ncbi:hypothetical protein D5018_09735 [Parashewanella curva]|uniref:Uncharacterized protein n=1 Tax=Parashewanella curva TaxID=2338552 RepID=A0A3L8PXA3_9GAMM|nr:hypothetical protein [Parashewanella curva]RLV59951.1 hypothetical protein D5018_09735 [Parashewanella curva]
MKTKVFIILAFVAFFFLRLFLSPKPSLPMSNVMNTIHEDTRYEMLVSGDLVKEGTLGQFYGCIKNYKDISPGSQFVRKEYRTEAMPFRLILPEHIFRLDFSGTTTITTLVNANIRGEDGWITSTDTYLVKCPLELLK